MDTEVIKIDFSHIDSHRELISCFDRAQLVGKGGMVELLLDFSTTKRVFVHSDHLLAIVALVCHLRESKDRALFYVSRLIQRLLKKGKASNDYQLPEVYLIGILEFSMDTDEQDRYFHDIALMEKTSGEVFHYNMSCSSAA